ncbi:MAG: hypothetical protein K2M78_10190 [Lachnospiraceae bacterium]|nr:hypothetical protein [Lachnospiraceae bacterium]
MNISTEINPKEDLKEKLTDNTYQLIVTIHPFDNDIVSVPYLEERVIRKLTLTNFIRQTERSAFQELVRMSGLPSFVTNLSIKDEIMHTDSTNRICIPLLDDDAKIQFYCSTTKQNREYLDVLL